MKLGIISDTHGNIEYTRRFLDAFANHSVDLIIHCGDIGVEAVPLFDPFTVHFVCGNTDAPEKLRQVISNPAHTLHEPMGMLEIQDCKIAFLHGDDASLLQYSICSEHWDLVCHGHTHVFETRKVDNTTVLNPGAVMRTPQPSVAVVELPSLKILKVAL